MKTRPGLRLQAAALALALAVATYPAAGFAAGACGDLNSSGGVNTTDALQLLRFAVGQNVAISCPSGLSCWDNNTNGTCDANEDVTGDLACSVDDCVGPQGAPGLPGAPGSPGAPGPPGLNASQQGLMVLSADMTTQVADTSDVVFSSDDDAVAVRNIGFPFVIAGVTYTQVMISSNGWIVFDPAFAEGARAQNSCLPSPITTKPFIAAFWDDLVSFTVSAVQGDAPGRVFTVFWDSEFFADPDQSVAFVVSLHEQSNMITVKYLSSDPVSPGPRLAGGESATIGFQANATKAYPIGCNADVAAPIAGTSNLGVSVQFPGWSISPVR